MVADLARYDDELVAGRGLARPATEQCTSGARPASPMSTGAGGQMQAVEVGNQIAEQQVEQLMSLRQLMLTDLQSKQAYQAEQIQKEQADNAALEHLFGTQPLVTDQKKY